MKAEQLARAKAWHDARTNKAKGGAAAASSSSSSSSSFYAGMTTTTTTPTQLSVVRPPLSTSQFAVGDKRKDSERDRRKRDGMAAIRALREARASTGLADGRTEKRKSPPAMTNSHNPPNRAFEAESAARTSTSASTSDSPAMALSFVEMDAVNEHDGDGGDIQDADGEINEDGYIANEEDEEDDVNGDRMTMDATSRTTGVPSHPLGEMAIHSNLVDADRADNHGHDGEANNDGDG
jgi:hypothetical protein